MTCRILRWLSLPLVCAVGIAAGTAETPSSWTDDLAPITPRDWTYQRAAHLIAVSYTHLTLPTNREV